MAYDCEIEDTDITITCRILLRNADDSSSFLRPISPNKLSTSSVIPKKANAHAPNGIILIESYSSVTKIEIIKILYLSIPVKNEPKRYTPMMLLLINNNCAKTNPTDINNWGAYLIINDRKLCILLNNKNRIE